MEQLELFATEESTSSSAEPPASPSPSRENARDLKVPADLHITMLGLSERYGHGGSSGKTCLGLYRVSPTATNETSTFFSSSLASAGTLTWDCGGTVAGVCSIPSMCEWNLSLAPSLSVDGVCSLSDILQPTAEVDAKYYLSRKACEGILRRAASRGKELPEILRKALEEQMAQDVKTVMHCKINGQRAVAVVKDGKVKFAAKVTELELPSATDLLRANA